MQYQRLAVQFQLARTGRNRPRDDLAERTLTGPVLADQGMDFTIIDGQALLQDARVRYEKSELSFEEYSKILISTNGNIQTKLEIEANMLAAIASIEELSGPGFMELKKQYGTK